jgi:hypothetical protein
MHTHTLTRARTGISHPANSGRPTEKRYFTPEQRGLESSAQGRASSANHNAATKESGKGVSHAAAGPSLGACCKHVIPSERLPISEHSRCVLCSWQPLPCVWPRQPQVCTGQTKVSHHGCSARCRSSREQTHACAATSMA